MMKSHYLNSQVPNLPLFARRLQDYLKEKDIFLRNIEFAIDVSSYCNTEGKTTYRFGIIIEDYLQKALKLLPTTVREKHLLTYGFDPYFNERYTEANSFIGGELAEIADDLIKKFYEYINDANKYTGYFKEFEKTEEATSDYYKDFVNEVNNFKGLKSPFSNKDMEKFLKKLHDMASGKSTATTNEES